MAGQVSEALDEGPIAEHQQRKDQTKHIIRLEFFFIDVVLGLGDFVQVVQSGVETEQIGDEARVDHASTVRGLLPIGPEGVHFEIEPLVLGEHVRVRVNQSSLKVQQVYFQVVLLHVVFEQNRLAHVFFFQLHDYGVLADIPQKWDLLSKRRKGLEQIQKNLFDFYRRELTGLRNQIFEKQNWKLTTTKRLSPSYL